MSRDTPCESDKTLRVDGILVELSLAGEHTPIYIILGSHANSWETTVISQTLDTSTAREISLPTSNPSFQKWISCQCNKK